MKIDSSTQWRRVRAVLDDVVDVPAEDRQREVDRLCRGDEDLLREVLEFLELDDRAETFIEEPLWRVLPRSDGSSEGDGEAPVERIGPYRLERLLGKGGMGEVHLAVREDDYAQKVAIKRSLGQRWREDLVERFFTERQILADLQHPGIARLLDGGADEDGAPYLVMEYVDGEPIDEYCAGRELDLRSRLRLVSEVCRIVHHAHKRLIVHRDLKPSNILVNADGQPRLLDFGIAKLLDPAADAVATDRHRAVMTPACASPEQIMGEPITTACDVYALGVLLYQLLVGRAPYDLSGLTFPEIRRIVCLREREKPSVAAAKISSAAGKEDERASASASRHARRLRGDLDAIVAKAMRKEAEHRYGSAAEMADDIDRYLEALPVQARRGNWYYHAGKHMRRNKPVVALLLLIVGLAVVSSVLGWQAEVARRSAVEAQVSAESLKDVLVEILRSSSPNESQGRDLTVREVLEGAKPKIDRGLAGRPGLQAEMLNLLGGVFGQLGDRRQALALHLEAVEREREKDPRPHSALADYIASSGSAHYNLRDYEAAERSFREALAMRERIDDEPLAIATTLYNLANALKLQGRTELVGDIYRRVLEIRRAESASPEGIAATLYALGAWELQRGALDAAIDLLEEALRLRRENAEHRYDTDVSSVAKTLARARHAAGDLEAARALYDEALESHRLLLGEEHSRTRGLETHFARLLLDLGETSRACEMARQAADRATESRPEGDSIVVIAESVVGACRLEAGDAEAGARLLREGVAVLEEIAGRDAFTTTWTRRRLESAEPGREGSSR